MCFVFRKKYSLPEVSYGGLTTSKEASFFILECATVRSNAKSIKF